MSAVIAECAKRLTAGLSDVETGVVTRFLSDVAQTFTEQAGR